jgi:ectoine hydroxylase-related dioxygenase (phytanoyl-CoA dioxygenase family)
MSDREPGSMYHASITADETRQKQWIEQFNRDGYLFLKSVLPEDWCGQLRADLEKRLRDDPNGDRQKGSVIHLSPRLFEDSEAAVALFDMDPIASFAEALIGGPVHVIHNNSFVTPPGGGISSWHQDDAPHYIVTDGEPPTNVRLPVLFFTVNYYLTDVTEPMHGATETIPGSHLIGAACPSVIDGTEWESQVECNTGPVGSVCMFNNQVWHRGGPNRSNRLRYMVQVTYARRIIGHKYYPFMNYEMPEHVYRDADPRLKQLLGFLPHGAYG